MSEGIADRNVRPRDYIGLLCFTTQSQIMSLSCVFVTLLCVFVSVRCNGDSDEENSPPLSNLLPRLSYEQARIMLSVALERAQEAIRREAGGFRLFGEARENREPLGSPPRRFLRMENVRMRIVDLSDEETRDDWMVEVDQRRLVTLENRMQNRDGASTSQTSVLSLEASERLNSSRSSSPSLLAGLDSPPIPLLPGYNSPPPPRARCAVCQMGFVRQAQVEAQVERLSSAQPCPWMEQPAAQVLEEAEVWLGEALWVSRHAEDTGVGRRLAPAVWNHLRGAIGAVLDFSGEGIEAARYWTTPPPPPGTTPTPVLALPGNLSRQHALSVSNRRHKCYDHVVMLFVSPV